MAILRGLKHCTHVSISHPIIESKVVVNHILQDDFSYSDIGNQLQDVKKWMKKYLVCKIQFDCKSNNATSHALSHYA